MSNAEQLQEYAEEALRLAFQSENEKDKQALLDLARTWTQAAFASDRIVVVSGSTPEPRAP
jgi:hypothetical protein